jgi:hypothetical protein
MEHSGRSGIATKSSKLGPRCERTEACLTCMPYYMYAIILAKMVHRTLFASAYMNALSVCLICVPYMYALHLCQER